MCLVYAEVHASASARLRRSDGRYTRQRRELVDLLLDAGKPLTVEELNARAPHLAVSSVYRNLAVLEETGLVRRLTGHGNLSRFELAEDLTGHHHHFACSRCGAMNDVKLPDPIERRLARVLGNLAREQGFEIDSHRLDILGRCRDCARGCSAPDTVPSRRRSRSPL